MHYSNIGQEDIIDTFGVYDLVPTYLRSIQTLPFPIEDSAQLDDKPIEVPIPFTKVLSLPSSSFLASSLASCVEILKKRKMGKTSTPQMQSMDIDDFEFEEVILKDTVVINTQVTYFEESVFGWPDIKKNIFNHFESDA